MLGITNPALPASLRRTNERTVISLLFRLGRASRADLAKAAGISQPTAGKIIGELLESGIVQETELESEAGQGLAPRPGRPGQLLSLSSKKDRFIAVEIGISETRVTTLPVALQAQERWAHSFATPSSPEEWLSCLRGLPIDPRGFWGTLVSVPGIVDEPEGAVVFCPNLHWLEKANLPALVSEVWKVPVLLLQEIRALALGHLTAEPGLTDYLLVDLGHGVGGAVVSGGKLLVCALPLIAELGHTPVAGNNRRCGCGASGCLETLVSTKGLLESYATHVKNGQAGWDSLTAHAAKRGVEPWLARTLDSTADVIAGALNALGLRRVIVTGNLSELPENAFARLEARVCRGALWARFGSVECFRAPRRRSAGLVASGIDRLLLPSTGGTERGRTFELAARILRPTRTRSLSPG
jgi:predicted NBD/HSP70 family sugar kinase